MTAFEAEVAEWRRLHTWGGFLWFTEGQVKTKRLPGPELLDEVEWLLDGQVHPLLIVEQVHRERGSILKLANKYGRTRVAEAFKQDAHEERMRRAA